MSTCVCFDCRANEAVGQDAVASGNPHTRRVRTEESSAASRFEFGYFVERCR